MGEKVSLGTSGGSPEAECPTGGGAALSPGCPPHNCPLTPCLKHLHMCPPPQACRPPWPWPGLPAARRLQTCPWLPMVRVCGGAGSGALTLMHGQGCPAQTRGRPVWPLQPQPGSSWDGARSQDGLACHEAGKTQVSRAAVTWPQVCSAPGRQSPHPGLEGSLHPPSLGRDLSMDPGALFRQAAVKDTGSVEVHRGPLWGPWMDPRLGFHATLAPPPHICQYLPCMPSVVSRSFPITYDAETIR